MRASGARRPRNAAAVVAFAGAEQCSCILQSILNPLCGRVRAAEHAPRGPFHVLERRHGLAEIVERGAGVHAESRRIILPHLQRELMTLAENASRRGHRFAHQ